MRKEGRDEEEMREGRGECVGIWLNVLFYADKIRLKFV